MKLTEQTKTFEWASAPTMTKADERRLAIAYPGEVFIHRGGITVTCPEKRSDWAQSSLQVAPQDIDALIEALRVARATGISMYGTPAEKLWTSGA